MKINITNLTKYYPRYNFNEIHYLHLYKQFKMKLFKSTNHNIIMGNSIF